MMIVIGIMLRTKMIVDATKPDGSPPDRYVMADVPADAVARIALDRGRFFPD